MSVPRPNPDAVPSAPGVYRFLGPEGRVLYVGKAKNLRRRLLSYFRAGVAERTGRMLEAAQALDWVVCASETEALTLEREWINAQQPPFNIRLREGAGYSGIAVSTGEMVPRLFPWRGRRPAGTETFGPYPGASSRELLDALMVAFGVRSCSDVTYRRAEAAGKACLLADTGRCSAPCVGRISVEEHRARAERLVAHLRRPDPEVRDRLEAEMRDHAAAENFEAAARRRDQLAALEIAGQLQRVLGPAGWDRDLVAVARGDGYVGAAVVRVVDGVVASVTHLDSIDDPELPDDELEAATCEIARRRGLVAAATVIAGGNGDRRRRPRGARERDAYAFAATQAEQARLGAGVRPWADPEDRLAGLGELAAALGVTGPLRRIECIDISHSSGRDAIGSLVVLLDAEAAEREFRHVKLGETGGDDYAAIAEVVRRRFTGRKMGLTDHPDLLLIDGGPGQIASARRVLDELGVQVPAWGLAKRLEELWYPAATQPILLEAGSLPLRIVQHARDQAHRTALRAHRRQRENTALRTRLDDIDGLGPARRRALLERFGSLDALAAASVADLAGTPGIGPVLAQAIHARLTG